MKSFQNMSWYLGIIAFVALFTGSSMMLTNDLDEPSANSQFSVLSDADIDMILAVKAEMQSAKIRSN